MLTLSDIDYDRLALTLERLISTNGMLLVQLYKLIERYLEEVHDTSLGYDQDFFLVDIARTLEDAGVLVLGTIEVHRR